MWAKHGLYINLIIFFLYKVLFYSKSMIYHWHVIVFFSRMMFLKSNRRLQHFRKSCQYEFNMSNVTWKAKRWFSIFYFAIYKSNSVFCLYIFCMKNLKRWLSKSIAKDIELSPLLHYLSWTCIYFMYNEIWINLVVQTNAILVNILFYSTVTIFDRTRENLQKKKFSNIPSKNVHGSHQLGDTLNLRKICHSAPKNVFQLCILVTCTFYFTCTDAA